MIFCGECGLQLAPGSTRCPRCGAVVEARQQGEQIDIQETGMHGDSPTVASQSILGRNTRPSNPQQPLILGSGNTGYDYPQEDAFDATRAIENPNFQTGQAMGNSFVGYPTQGQSAYPEYSTQQQVPYQSGPGYQQMGIGYPDQYHQEQEANMHAKGRTTGLVLIVLGLLFILSAVVLFALQQGFFGVTI